MLQPVHITVALTILFSIVLVFIREKNKKKKLIISKNKQEGNNTRQNIDHLREIAEKLDFIMRSNKMYTNPELSIHDLAEMIGTNRSYVSSSINIFYNQNFCTYINQYRLNELKDTIIEEGKATQKELAVKCGFGSIDTMKRAIKQKTGLNMKDWKEYIFKENQENNNSGFV